MHTIIFNQIDAFWHCLPPWALTAPHNVLLGAPGGPCDATVHNCIMNMEAQLKR